VFPSWQKSAFEHFMHLGRIPAFNQIIKIVFCEVDWWAQAQPLEAFLHL
jgi:hypothetical protein